MIKEIENYFLTYPKIAETDEIIGHDYLPADSDSYAIYSAGDMAGGWLKKWIGGKGTKQFSFIFASRFTYSPVAVQNIVNSEFYIDLQNWIEENNTKRNFPDIPGVQKIEIVQTGVLALVDESQSLAEYQMTAKLIYDVL